MRDFNFDEGVLTVHGKGKNDRTLPLPKTIIAESKSQIETVGKLHDRDLADRYAILFFPHDSKNMKMPVRGQRTI